MQAHRPRHTRAFDTPVVGDRESASVLCMSLIVRITGDNREVINCLHGDSVPKCAAVRKWVSSSMQIGRCLREMLQPYRLSTVWVSRKMNHLADAMCKGTMYLEEGFMHCYVSTEWMTKHRTDLPEVWTSFNGGSSIPHGSAAAVAKGCFANVWYTLRIKTVHLGERTSMEAECLGMRFAFQLLAEIVAYLCPGDVAGGPRIRKCTCGVCVFPRKNAHPVLQGGPRASLSNADAQL